MTFFVRREVLGTMNQTSAESGKKDRVSGGGREESAPDSLGADQGKGGEKPLEKMAKTELLEKVEELKDTAQKNYELYLRSQADMENLRKRGQKEKEEWAKFSNETLIRDLLPALDALEQALSHCDMAGEDCFAALKQGVELTLKGLKDALGKAGLEEVRAQGEAFDPNYHEAVSEIEDKSAEGGAVLQELQKGYLLNQRLLRPAMVVVNRNNQASQGENDG
jgi:molecular chaperone GrpE